jgi:hypothetical protein
MPSVIVCNLVFWYLIFSRDQRLHRLVFEEGGLPDGTELAYYARGQVINITYSYSLTFLLLIVNKINSSSQKLLGGYKRGFGILCRCCNCEVLLIG